MSPFPTSFLMGNLGHLSKVFKCCIILPTCQRVSVWQPALQSTNVHAYATLKTQRERERESATLLKFNMEAENEPLRTHICHLSYNASSSISILNFNVLLFPHNGNFVSPFPPWHLCTFAYVLCLNFSTEALSTIPTVQKMLKGFEAAFLETKKELF